MSIKQKAQELIDSNKTYEILLEVNGDIMVFEVILSYSEMEGSGLEWKVSSRPREIKDEEVDEIDDFIRDKFTQ